MTLLKQHSTEKNLNLLLFNKYIQLNEDDSGPSLIEAFFLCAPVQVLCW